jgi:hypothetical protein
MVSHRYFYNGRVWWNSPDHFHVYALGEYTPGMGRTHASFCGFAANLLYLGEPFALTVEREGSFPADRVEIAKKVALAGMDTSRPLDYFETSHPAIWHMPIQRAFGSWDLLALFSYYEGEPRTFRVALDRLGLDPNGDYLVYEFWSNRFVGTVRGTLEETIAGADCGIYSIVPKRDHPQLISTSHHIRHMANDILDLEWLPNTSVLRGRSEVVAGEPYELRVHTPEPFVFDGAVLTDAEGDPHVMREDTGPIVRIQFTPRATGSVEWQLTFHPEDRTSNIE